MRFYLPKVMFAFIVLTLISISAEAQFTVSGKVSDTEGESLVGVTVLVKNTTSGTVTDIDGNYVLQIPGSSATLVFFYVGFKTVEQEVSSATSTVNMIMETTTSTLDEVVISGLATSVKRTNLANSVETISGASLNGTTQQSTLDGALYGKINGAQITANSGAPGGGIGIRMRGITSINAPAQPLFIIDGVYVDNSSIAAGLNLISGAAAGGNTAVFDQDNPSNRIADIDPGDIENIEILKGASAAAIYGSRAAGGVVIITTKRGKKSGAGANISLSQSLGATQIINPQGTRPWNSENVEAFYGAAEVPVFEAAEADGKIYDYEDELFGNTGMLSDTRLSVAGNSDRTSYYTSGSFKSEGGIVPNTGYEKTGLRLNIDHEVNKHIDLSVSNNFIKSSADRGFFNNDNTGTTMSISMVATPAWAELHPDDQGNYPDNPYSASNFLQTAELMTNNESVDRYIGGATSTIDLFTKNNQSLKLVLTGGVDFYNLVTTAIFPRELQFEKNGNGTNGASIQGSTHSFNNNESGLLVHTFYGENGITFRTQGGLTREQFDRNTIIVTATELIGAQTNVNQAGAVSTYQNIVKQLDKGGFIQEEVNFNDRIYVTAGVRGDKSSNNGDPNKLYFYPKASLALTLSEFDSWSMEKFDFAKLRVAYGQSGNFAPFGSAFTSLGSTNIGGLAGSLINTQRGNPDVAPERQSELEFGFDLGFFKDRVTVEATYYIKTVTDLLLVAQVPESSGFSSQVTNAADLQNKGVELGIGADIVSGDKFDWYTHVNFWMNRSEITRLDIPEFAVGSFGTTLGTYYIQEGASATQLVGIAPVDETGNPDGLFELDQTGDNLPEGLDVFGDAEPDFQLSWANELSHGNWDLSFLIHWKKGGDNVNLTQLLSDIFGTSPDFDEVTYGQPDAYPNGLYRLTSIGVTASTFVQDASYVRLREIGLYYSFDGDKLASKTNNFIRGIRVGASGYNLLNFFDYSSYDPEVSNFGTTGISTGIEVNPFPSAKRYYGHITFNF
ncbi:MAG: SusC/RagA family TonB-linked outer membrane protein [Chitinophagales bacterium]